MALPMRLTWNLQMPRNKKVGILLLFASGVVAILFACLRVTQVAINAAKPEAEGQPLDPTWLAIWGMVECAIGICITGIERVARLTFHQPSSLVVVLHSLFSPTPYA
jgi:hypothetical protein